MYMFYKWNSPKNLRARYVIAIFVVGLWCERRRKERDERGEKELSHFPLVSWYLVD